MIKNKKKVVQYVAVFFIAFLLGSCLKIQFKTTEVHYKVYQSQNIIYAGTPTTFSLHINLTGSISQYDENNDLIFYAQLGSAMTNIGKNYTVMKFTGNLTAQFISDFMENLTYIAMGSDVGLTTSSTVLPNEWNRTLADQEILDMAFNLTAIIYPDASGSTNSTSICWKSGIGTDNSTWCYDTFATRAYTINDYFMIEWGIMISYT